MALPAATLHPTPQVVASAFVEQYYNILHQSPDQVHKFYQDSSILCRPNYEGEMSSVTTLQGINEKILSFNFRSYITKIETVDSASSYNDGVLIAVIGCLIGSDDIRHKFTQLFFLAPQDNRGYFVLNDIFRFIDNSHSTKPNQVLPKEPDLVQENYVEELPTPPSELDVADCEEVVNQSENDCSGVEDEVSAGPLNHSDQPGVQLDEETATVVAQDNGPKKSYASIVKVVGSTPPKIIPPAIKDKVSPSAMNLSKPLNDSAGHADSAVAKVPTDNGIEGDTNHEEGYSIYIRNLPLHATVEQVEEEVRKFGPVKPSGIQVRNHKVDPYCFGFVEFESLNSMHAAIKASHILVGGRKAFIEEKKTSTRVINGVVFGGYNGRGRFPLGRGGYRNDNMRGNDNLRGKENFIRGNDNHFRGNNNHQGYARTDFRMRAEYSGGRGRGNGNNTRGGYHQQRPFQNVNAPRTVHPVQTPPTAA